MANTFLLILFAYLIGSIPFGLIVSKITSGTDPRTQGSGNIGFTNVFRTVSKKAGIYTLIGDVGKGFLAITALPMSMISNITEPQLLLIGFGVVIGHCYPVFLYFRGGKGVATALCAIAGIDPVLATLLLGIWILALAIWKFSALAALLSSASLPIIVAYFYTGPEKTIFAVALAIVIWVRHKDNIKRLIQGAEPRIRPKS